MRLWGKFKSLFGVREAQPAAPTLALPEPQKAAGQKMLRALDGARTDRLTFDWIQTPSSADDYIRNNQRKIVARSREMGLNSDHGKSFFRMVWQNIVGSNGVQLIGQVKSAEGSLDQKANDGLELAWADWCKKANCDVTGKQSFRSLLASAAVAAARDGEFFVRTVFGADAGPWGFALQLIDSQRCDTQFDQTDLPGGNFIRHGIEFNRYGRPLAYHFTVIDERDAFYNYSFNGRKYHRIPADEIIHGFLPELVGQKRGMPWTTTSLFRMHQMRGFENAAVVAARVGASKMGVVQWREGRGPEIDDDEKFDWQLDLEPGSFPVLPEGAELNKWDPQYPANEFAAFHKAMLRGVASGLGVAYNNLANDLEGVNFSSIRQGALDEREWWKVLQEWLIENLIEPVYEAWLPRALLAGRIRKGNVVASASKIDAYRSVMWQARRWQWIDPAADVEAAVKSKNNLLQSPGQIIREQGRDPQDVWAEIARDIEQMKAAGIPDDMIQSALFGQNMSAVVSASQPAKAPAK